MITVLDWIALDCLFLAPPHPALRLLFSHGAHMYTASFEIFTPLDGLLDTDMGMAPVNDAVVPSAEATSG